MLAKEDGSVNQRFLIAILQKVSIKVDTVSIFVDLGVMQFVGDLVSRTCSEKVNKGGSGLAS